MKRRLRPSSRWLAPGGCAGSALATEPLPTADARIEGLEKRVAGVERQSGAGTPAGAGPVPGHEGSAAIAKEALATGGSVYDLVLAKGWLTRARLDDLREPEDMTGPR